MSSANDKLNIIVEAVRAALIVTSSNSDFNEITLTFSVGQPDPVLVISKKSPRTAARDKDEPPARRQRTSGEFDSQP